ncbi:MAG: hypothetical protein IKR65_00245, partial [Selenomonadaceae bacterium]|nr:hypothetical protein [Selenomonadaceae bacterium]
MFCNVLRFAANNGFSCFRLKIFLILQWQKTHGFSAPSLFERAMASYDSCVRAAGIFRSYGEITSEAIGKCNKS